MRTSSSVQRHSFTSRVVLLDAWSPTFSPGTSDSKARKECLSKMQDSQFESAARHAWQPYIKWSNSMELSWFNGIQRSNSTKTCLACSDWPEDKQQREFWRNYALELSCSVATEGRGRPLLPSHQSEGQELLGYCNAAHSQQENIRLFLAGCKCPLTNFTVTLSHWATFPSRLFCN